MRRLCDVTSLEASRKVISKEKVIYKVLKAQAGRLKIASV